MGESNYRTGIDRRSMAYQYYGKYRRFSNISISERILNTCFLLAIGIGYLVALANIYYTHQGRDGKPGLSVKDVMINYHGSPDQTRLGIAIKGVMEGNLKYKSDKEVILKWIQSGALEPEYIDHIAPVLNRDCVTCHSPAVNPSLPDLTNYTGVAQVASAGGVSLPCLIRIHDLRHTFAVRRVMLWHKHGADIDQAMLALSTYLGHAKISNTYWYLTAVPELMAIAADKFELYAQASAVDDD
jgi:hypothetical protein